MDILKFFQNSLGLYFGKYKEGAKYLNKEVKWFGAFLFAFALMVISNIIGVVFNPIAYRGVFNQIGVAGVSMFLLGIIGVLFNLLFFVIFVFGGYGLLHLFFKMFGGKGLYTDTIKYGMALLVFPTLVNFVTSIFGGLSLLGGEILMSVISALIGFIGLGVFIWHVIMSVLVYSIAHDISEGKSFGALALTFVAFVIIGLVLLVFLLLMFFGTAAMMGGPMMY